MKGWLLALALALALTGCGSRTNPNQTNVTTPTQSMTTAPEVLPADGGIPKQPATGDTARPAQPAADKVTTRPTEPMTTDSTYTAREDGAVVDDTVRDTKGTDGTLAEGVRDVVDGTADAARDVTNGLVNGAERAADGVIDASERMADGVRRSADNTGSTMVN